MDFNDMIYEALRSGLSEEDIAKKFSDALNAIKQEKEVKTERDKVINALRESVECSVALEEFSLDDAAAVAVLAVISDHPDWTIDDINRFMESVEESIKAIADLIGKDFNSMVNVMKNKVNDLFITSNKKLTSDGSYSTISYDPEDIIREFVRKL